MKKESQTALPETLSKYFSLNENNIIAFLNRKLYANQPEYFNDLFDSSYLNIPYSKIEFKDIESLFDTVEERKKGEIEYSIDPLNYTKQFINALYAIWNSRHGTICMTGNINSDLMWAHYTNNEGFLIQFNRKCFPAHYGVPKPITYVNNIKSTLDAITQNFLSFSENCLIKKKCWKYENEYRFLVTPPTLNCFVTTGRFSNENHQYERESRLIDYPKEAIIKIVLAFNFFDAINSTKLSKGSYRVIFQSKDSILKSCLLNNIIENKIATELIMMDPMKSKLKPKSINITPFEGTSYEIHWL
jgi:hypothetical protein